METDNVATEVDHLELGFKQVNDKLIELRDGVRDYAKSLADYIYFFVIVRSIFVIILHGLRLGRIFPATQKMSCALRPSLWG